MKKLYFKEKLVKITDHYPVIDEDGKEAYYVDQDLKLVGYRVKIKNLATGEIILVERKILNLLPTYLVSFEDGTQMKVDSKLSLLKRKVDATYEGQVIKLRGEVFDFHFDIYLKNKLIGSLDKKVISLADHFRLKVVDEDYADLLVALSLCINNMKDEARKRKNAKSSD